MIPRTDAQDMAARLGQLASQLVHIEAGAWPWYPRQVRDVALVVRELERAWAALRIEDDPEAVSLRMTIADLSDRFWAAVPVDTLGRH